ncbi:unnamed protein product [Cylindrotheca closterium]|uniref:FAD-binding PCMH-type domain-containing protein n=1 Tax=Cylindrotheca closterium TaxID=2856 RepID=A0AAD2G5Q0_9STRA|nr:unnamed protein product [Cylindrotheca closterium]
MKFPTVDAVSFESAEPPARMHQRPCLSQTYSPPIKARVCPNDAFMYQEMISNQLQPTDPSIRKHSAVIVGAGLSGLAAARELKKSGMTVTVLESSDQSGGRCHTVKLAEGVYAEAGGMQLPTSHKLMMAFITLFRLKYAKFANMKDKSGLLFFDGKKRFINEELADPESLLAQVVQKWDKSIGRICTMLSNGSITWDDVRRKYCGKSLHEFLLEEKWCEELIQGFSKFGVGLGAYGSILELSLLEIIRLFVSEDGYEAKNVQLVGGMETLTKGFLFDKAVPLKESIVYNFKAASVTCNEVSGKFTIASLDYSVTYESDFVVMSAPLPALQSIHFWPPFRVELQEAVMNTHYINAIKIFLVTKSAFWLAHGVNGMVVLDLTVQNTYFVREELTCGKGLIIASYTLENQAEKFFGLSAEEQIQVAVEELKTIFPEMETSFESGFVHLGLVDGVGLKDPIQLVLVPAPSMKRERKATMFFKSKNCHCVLIPRHFVSYQVEFVMPEDNNFGQSNTVRRDGDKSNRDKVLAFLSSPLNMVKWTGHRAISYSNKKGDFVETRLGPMGELVSSVLCVSVEVLVPTLLPEVILAKIKRIVLLALDLLKALLEGNEMNVISDLVHHGIQAHHLSIYNATPRSILPTNAGEKFLFEGQILRQGELFDTFSTAFALTIRTKPVAALCPIGVVDIPGAVAIANAYNLPLAVRGSKVSHLAGGQAHSHHGFVLDMSKLASVEILDNQLVKVGAGTYWDEVVWQTLGQGLMPPVVNDYQFLSVGGTISMGGVGFMLHRFGVQAANVEEMEVVTGCGSTVVCNPNQNCDLFDSVRAGLGQCDIITSVTLPLVPAPKRIALFKLFYDAKDADSFVNAMKRFSEHEEIDNIQAFPSLVP